MEKEQFNKQWAIVEIFKSICIRNSSYNATKPISELWELAKKLADEIYVITPPHQTKVVGNEETI